LENRNHYTLLFNSPVLGEIDLPGWFFYNDIEGCIKRWDAEISYGTLLKLTKVPVLLLYRLIVVKKES